MNKKLLATLGAVVLVTILAHILLPILIKNQLNKNLSTLPEYKGWVDDVDLVLFRGFVALNRVTLDQEASADSVPFVSINRIEFGIDWGALFHGQIVADVNVFDPEVNFIASEDTANQQYGGDYLWFEKLAEMRPIEINKLRINNGQIRFRKFDSDPIIDLKVTELNLVATNLRNVIETEKSLPSSVIASAQVLNGGHLKFNSQLNLLKEIPDLNLNLELESVQAVELNSFLLHYIKMDARKGELNFYSELAVENQEINGYLKPLFTDLKFAEKEDVHKNVAKLALESISDIAVTLLKNQKEDQVATKIPLSGTVKNSEIGLYKTLKNIFFNAFIEAFHREIDNTVSYPVSTSDESN